MTKKPEKEPKIKKKGSKIKVHKKTIKDLDARGEVKGGVPKTGTCNISI